VQRPLPAASIRTEVAVPLQLADGYSVPARVFSFDGLVDGREHLAFGLGDRAEPPLVRLHSECLTGDVFGSQRCDCGPQLREAVEHITDSGGYLLYLRLPAHPAYLTAVLPTMLLVGAGFALSFAALNTQATAGLAPAIRGEAAALYQSAVQIAAVLAPALAAALYQAGLTGGGNAALRPAVWLVVGIGAIGLVTALTAPAQQPGPVRQPAGAERS